jgi:hypothetical protein
MKVTVLICCMYCTAVVSGQVAVNKVPGNFNDLLLPLRIPFSGDPVRTSYIDFDKDGDADALKTWIYDSIQVCWIDDDDDMAKGAREGDTDNDCLLVDRNRDGIFAGPGDLSIDWVDSDDDGMADIQVVVENSDTGIRNRWDWQSNLMWIMDTDQDHIFNFIDWRELALKCWTHAGASDFLEDYHGTTLFLKTHAPSYYIHDLRYNWENPFLFYDPDGDGLSEMTIRLEDASAFRNNTGQDVDVYPDRRISRAFLSVDLDNDNGPQNEFDLDMTIAFMQGGFAYDNQVHRFNNLKGLPEANSLFFDDRWRRLGELIYPSHDSAWPMIFGKGNWGQCWMTFDEDDDCERWERVELAENKRPFKIGMNKGGLDNNPQADAAGDRGEWDMDNSGKGSLYIGFDGKIHLFGAETGLWRVDQMAGSYQGWGGLYEKQYARDQVEPVRFPTVSYEDEDKDGFFDRIAYDFNGDTVFEDTVSLRALGIAADYDILSIATSSEQELNAFFIRSANEMWGNASKAIQIARMAGINTDWYALYMTPKSIWQRYDHGYWLQLYLFRDLMEQAEKTGKHGMVEIIKKAYYSRNWGLLAKTHKQED